MGKQLHLIISGDVHGVGFRFGACDRAQELGVTGWVRNNVDGTVEVIAQGDEAQLTSYLSWCEQGTAFARVEDVTILWEEPSEEYGEFCIVHSV